MRLRIVTYNIHKGIGGGDRRYRLERISETLAHLDPHIAFLQEVDEGVPRSRGDRQAELLAETLNFKYFAYQRNVHLTRGWYGNAILSRFPLADVTSCNLTIPFKKRRQALLARCRLSQGHHTRSLLLANAHLGLAGPERVLQLRRILQHDLLAQAHEDTPILLGGDFNDVWSTLGKKVLLPKGYHPAGDPIRTFPALLPLRSLDRLFFRGPLRLHHAFSSRTRLARQASDHLPLVADFRVQVP